MSLFFSFSKSFDAKITGNGVYLKEIQVTSHIVILLDRFVRKTHKKKQKKKPTHTHSRARARAHRHAFGCLPSMKRMRTGNKSLSNSFFQQAIKLFN